MKQRPWESSRDEHVDVLQALCIANASPCRKTVATCCRALQSIEDAGSLHRLIGSLAHLGMEFIDTSYIFIDILCIHLNSVNASFTCSFASITDSLRLSNTLFRVISNEILFSLVVFYNIMGEEITDLSFSNRSSVDFRGH